MLLNKKLHRAIITVSVITLALIIFNNITAYALSDSLEDNMEVLKDIYRKNSDLFIQNTLFSSAFRAIGAGILSLLVMLADGAATLFEKSFGMIDFTKYQGVKDFIDDWDVVWVALICVSLAWLGVTLIFNSDKKPKVVTNICIAILVITSMTWMVGKMNTLINKNVRNEILGKSSNQNVYTILGNNIRDLLYIDKTYGLEKLNKKDDNGTQISKITTPMTEEIWDQLDINDIVKPDDARDESRVIVENYSSQIVDKDGKYYQFIQENYDGVAWTDLLNTYYYRYVVDWSAAYLEIIAIMIIYFFFAYKVVRILYEIVLKEIIAILYSANLTSSQKALKILDDIKNSYIIILISLISIRIFTLASSYVSGKSWNGFIKGFIIIFIAFAVIDGPNIIQQLTGVDAGASDGLQKAMSMYYGGQFARSLGRAAATPFKAAGRGISKMGGSKGNAAQQAFSNHGGSGGSSGPGMSGQGNDGSSSGAANAFNDNHMNETANINAHNENNNSNSSSDSNSQGGNGESSGNSGTNSTSNLDGNVNADGRNGEINDDAISSLSPEQAKADALNGTNPLGNSSEGLSSTEKMDQELDNPNHSQHFSDGKRGVLDTKSNYGISKTIGSSKNDKSNPLKSHTKTKSIPPRIKYVTDAKKDTLKD